MQVDVPVALVGNKNDQIADRMVTLEEGQKRSQEIGCVFFHEISVRESIEQVFFFYLFEYFRLKIYFSALLQLYFIIFFRFGQFSQIYGILEKYI